MITVMYDGTELTTVTSVTWSGDIKQAARKIDVRLRNTADGRNQTQKFEHGRELRLLNDGKELFRGVLFAFNVNARGDTTLTAYDENTYLTRNKDTRVLRNLTASAIIRQLCAEFGIPTGEIADTGYVIPKLILRDKTIWDMMITALTVTQKQTGRRYFIISHEGKLNLLARKEQAVRWVIENGVNLIGASYSQSIEDMRTQIKVIGGDPEKKPLVAVAKNDALIKRYGTMQHLENVDSDMTASQIRQLAEQRLKDLGTIDDEASVESLGIDEVTAGTGVYVRESMTGLFGGYYVTADTHTWEGGTYRMNLTLSATDELPTLEYDEPPETKRKKKGKGGETDVIDQIFGATGTD